MIDNNPNAHIVQNMIQQTVFSTYPSPIPSQILYSVHTDINQWPYPRFFRGQASSYSPIIFEREAGYSPIDVVPSVLPIYAPVQTTPQTCFQVPCTTVFPCSNSQRKPNFLANPVSCIYTSP